MALLAPPPSPPRIAQADDDRLRRFRMRLMRIMATAVTVVLTGWFCTFGVIPAIVAVMIAKHVLVAILMMGLGVDAPGGMTV
jgi:hypothetical protein